MAHHPPLAGLPEQLALRPGVTVARHDDHCLQVGIDPPQRVVVPDVPAVRRLLDALIGSNAPPAPDEQTWPVLRRLWEAGLLVDSRAVAASAAHGPAAAVRAAWAQVGPEAGERLTARAAARVRVVAEDEARADMARLLRASGVQVVEDGAADVWLVAHDGELPRARVDDLVREGVAHLLVSGALGSAVVGPFVLPGVTACLRCLDAHRAEVDPRRALVIEQVVARPPAVVRDPTLHAMALAWATRDVVRFVEGAQPSTWSTSFELGPLSAPVGRTWTRHPHCGCAWDEGLLGRVG
ncbi:hypothetical protein [Nocardioides psychrotolerans]|uniref:hypothetical protein n=1 Tax=Nocardioides psychrotolerans TaxID=1005945 RepID=UPI00313826FE